MMKRYLSMLSIGAGAVMTVALWAKPDDPIPPERIRPKLKPPASGLSPSDAAKTSDKTKTESAAKKLQADEDRSFNTEPPALPPLDSKKAAKPVRAEEPAP